MFSTYILPSILAIIVYFVGLGVYRLYFSPISHIPGPKLAALTLWYEFYYDVIVGGQYTFHIAKLHDKYGPIIRINPYEVHVSDPEYWNTIYAGGKEKRDKWGWYTKQFGTLNSALSTTGHEQHRIRRAALNQFFSQQSVKTLQPLIEERVEAVLKRLKEFKESNKVLNTVYLYAAYTNDVIMQYSFGWNDKCTEAPDFLRETHDSFMRTSDVGFIVKHFGWVLSILELLPNWLLTKIEPSFAASINAKRAIRRQVTQVIKGGSEKSSPYRTIFHELLTRLPEKETTVPRMSDEAYIVVAAGTTTTTWTLAVIHYQLLKNTAILEKLRTELEAAIPDPNITPSLTALEKLPYLTAVIKEGLRLSYGVSSRSQRISYNPMIINDGSKDWTIPPKTPVSMTSILVHHNERIYPNSKEFMPERWIGNPRLDKYLVSFSKGSRHCVGMNLAWAELYIILAAVWRQYGSTSTRRANDTGIMELFETTDRDVEVEADYFLPAQQPGTQGIRIKISA